MYQNVTRTLARPTLGAAFILLFVFGPIGRAGTVPAGAGSGVQSPLFFAALGSEDEPRFLARARGYNAVITPSGLILQPHSDGGTHSVGDEPAVSILAVGGGPAADLRGEDLRPGTSNYFLGRDTTRWRTHVDHYGRVLHAGVYPGIDLVYYGNDNRLEFDFIVHPGADPRNVLLNYDGADALSIDHAGNLIVELGHQRIVQPPPDVYQIADGRESVHGAYRVDADGRIGFELEVYDPARVLIIDPILEYASYLGGSGSDGAGALVVDQDGFVYVAGFTDSSDFPIQNALQPGIATDTADVFVTKLDPTTNTLIYSTYFGGNGADGGRIRMGVTPAGEVVVSAFTASDDLPLVNEIQQTLHDRDLFVAKLSADGSSLIYSTYLGGTTQDILPESIRGLHVDEFGNAYLTGNTDALDFPVTASALGRSCGTGGGSFHQDAFFTKLGPAGSLEASFCFGGSNRNAGRGVTLDADGNIYLTGYTLSDDFPVVNPLQDMLAGARDAFVMKLDPGASTLLYSTYLGGEAQEYPEDIVLDSGGNIIISGGTSSTTFPTVNAIQPSLLGSEAAFITKIAASGDALIFSTYLGGTSDFGSAENIFGLDVDAADNIYVTTTTRASDFPLLHPIQAALSGPTDIAAARLSPTGALEYSTYLGGAGDEFITDAADVDAAGNFYIAGSTSSADAPLANPFQSTLDGVADAYIVKIAVGVTPSDFDGDGVADTQDNCSTQFNGDQRDTNDDGYGNICDPDLSNDGVINVVDLGLLKIDFFSTGPGLDADFNGDEVVNAVDLGVLKQFFFQTPGPSAIAP